ncbi:MAG TPA: hypothetical protein ENI65_03270 [Gammaproteobacteria bacterium]|nr:hypothetical protein [Gammaproteobacteria bacterium]
MPLHIQSTSLYLLSLFILLMSSSPIQMVKADSTRPVPGNYCPSANILMITAEDLSSSLELIMRSRAAQAIGGLTEMASTLNAAGTTLQQAASRGAGARTALLIHSIILARVNDKNDQLLAWFPLLHSAILALPDDQTQSAADDAVWRAEEILKRDQAGNPLEQLGKAQHFLTCDGLNLPLQAALDEHKRLIIKMSRKLKPVVQKDYDKIIDSLRNTMAFILEHSKKTTR